MHDLLQFLIVLIVSLVCIYYGQGISGWFDCIHYDLIMPCIHQLQSKTTDITTSSFKRTDDSEQRERKREVPWTSMLPKDIVRKVASMSGANIRLASKTTKEGFDESTFGSHGPVTSIDLSKLVFVAGLCRWTSRIDGTVAAISDNNTTSIEVMSTEDMPLEPVVLYKMIADDLFVKPIDLKIQCTVDTTNKERIAVVYSCVPCFRALVKMGWWTDSKCNLSIVVRDNVTYNVVVELKLLNHVQQRREILKKNMS